MVEGPYRSRPKGDEEFDPEKHVKVDEKSWVRKSAAETTKKAEAEANRRNVVIEEPNWFLRLFGKTNKENYHGVLHEEALETELGNLQFSLSDSGDGFFPIIWGTYKGHVLLLEQSSAKINNVKITKNDAKKIWKRLRPLIEQRDKNREKLKQTNDKLETKRPVLEVLGLLPQRPNKELPETKEPKQLSEKTEE